MATNTTIVIGRPQHGEIHTTVGTLAKAVNDVTTAATSVQAVTACKKGSSIVVIIVWTT